MGKTTGNYQEQLDELAQYLAKELPPEKRVTLRDQAEALNISAARYSGMRTDPRYKVTEGDVEALRHAFADRMEGFGQPTPLEQELATLKALAEDQARRLANQEEVIAGLARILEDPDEWVRRLAQVQAEIARLKEEE